MDLGAPPGTLPDFLWQRLKEEGQVFHLEAGGLLWVPGQDRLEAVYFVVRGLLRLYHPNHKGAAVTILAVGPGGMLGHHPALEDSPYATGAEAFLPSTLLSLPGATFNRWRARNDDFGRKLESWMLRDLNLHLMNTYNRLEIEHTFARERVARTLLALDRQFYLAMVSRQQIADLCNLTGETVVRTLSSFLREGVLERTKFTVLSEAERRALAEILARVEPLSLPYS